ncbi:MAG: hypothetical protein R6X06_05400 [Gammaproteobacteria bacterium]
MSEGLQLSRPLIDSVMQVIGQHDAEAQKDMMVAIQYLSAITGFFVADYPGSDAEREEVLEYLNGLMRHVCDDKRRQSQQPTAASPAAAPAGRSVATDNPAVGIWKPE